MFYAPAGPEQALQSVPAELHSHVQLTEFQILLPCEESSLQPITVAQCQEGLPATLRMAPAMWQIPGQAMDLQVAIPYLANLIGEAAEPSLRFMIQSARLVMAMLEAGDFAPAQKPGNLRFLPYWTESSLHCLSALAEVAPESMLTARFAAGEEPVYGVTPRNLAISLVGHALDACAEGFQARHTQAERPPRNYWHTKPKPVLTIMAPEEELEEGVPWAIQLLFAPVPGLPLYLSLDQCRDRVANSLFPENLTADTLEDMEFRLESIARRAPVFRRAMNMVDGKASLNAQELDQILDHLPLLEAENFDITLPGFQRMHRIAAKVSLTEEDDGTEGPRPWFNFNWTLALGDIQLSDEDIDKLSKSRSPLVHLESGPVLLTPKDRKALEEFVKRVDESGHRISFFEALRLRLGGATHLHGLALETLESSPRLDHLVKCLEQARAVEDRAVPPGFVGELRHYQARGHAWVYYLIDQGFGACLADDMGLGKTIQAITVMLDWRRRNPEVAPKPILVICPVSVLGNWRREVNRFAPELEVVMHHGKGRPRKAEEFAATTMQASIILTSYSLLQRDDELFQAFAYGGVILDEAQNIKNPNTRQSKAARALNGAFRLVLTGTPLENRPLDLWSIMDFLNEGLLGTKSHFIKTLEHPIIRQQSSSRAGVLAKLVRPFVLRRLKTDPDIISDLPEKTEQVVVTGLTKEQIRLYEQTVQKGLDAVENSLEGIQRRGAILTTLLRLKQVCNHPAHFHSDGSPLDGRSAKLDLLTEMLEEALAEGDRCLVFTQFKEMGTLLKTHVENHLNEKALFLHGGTPQKDRETMVNNFQEGAEEGPKIFVLSLKAGGTGLNLTQANRVFHYDRWWNPAVEDQATDRAFRIGQRRNVFVHKFVCTGTLEERIQTMLEQKREVANSLLGAGEGWITELSNEELRRLLVLDQSEAME